MPKALFFNVPAHGHVNPSLPLVSELVKRGHTISYFMTAQYRPAIEKSGAKFHLYNESILQDNFFEGQGLNGTRPQLTAQALAMASEALLPHVISLARAEKPHYILYDTMCPWGYFVAQILQVPSVGSLSLMPMISPSLSLVRYRAFWKLIGQFAPYMLRDLGANVETTKTLRRIVQKYRLRRPVNALSMLNADADIFISQLPREFPFFAEHLSKKVRFVGRDEPAPSSIPLPPEIRATADKKLIYISLGTVANQWREFFELCIQAFANSEYEVVISTGNGVEAATFSDAPKNIHVYNWVSQNAILKRAALFITHGGLNSIVDGFFAGVPLLLVPQQTEQAINSLRVVELGAGLMLKPKQVSAESLRTHVKQLLSDPHFTEASAKMGDAFRAGGGVKRAVDEIEAMLSVGYGV